MAKVVATSSALGSSLQINVSEAAPRPKRKTPTELRREQLKQACIGDQAKESFDALRPCVSTERENELQEQEELKDPKLTELHKRLNEQFPVKKPWTLMPSDKEYYKVKNAKDQSSSLINVTSLSNADDTNAKALQTVEACSQTIFRSVTDLSTRSKEKLSYFKDIDTKKPLKALTICDPLPFHPGEADTPLLSGNFVSEFHIPGQKIPLDLSMKTSARLFSYSPFDCLHRSIKDSSYNGMPNNGGGSVPSMVSQVVNPMALHSWVHPLGTLSPRLILAVQQDGGDNEFLPERQVMWQEAFRSLYIMFRNNRCQIFYVCCSQFVAMFTRSWDLKRSCHAYISRSTREFREILKEQDICYSMPQFKTNMDKTTAEDLSVLSEIANLNHGMTRRRSHSFTNIDNTPEPFLAFNGTENVDGFAALLLNYKHFLEFPNTCDVPVLYAPIMFKHAVYSSPRLKFSKMVKDKKTIHTVEIVGAYLPPWNISDICAHLSAAGQKFEASFETDPESVHFNVGLPETDEITTHDATSIPGAVIFPRLRSNYVESLEYQDNSYRVRCAVSFSSN